MPNFQNPYVGDNYYMPYFVLVAGDKELLRLLNAQFKKRGYLALALDNGRIEYYIDCRNRKLNADSRILHILQQNTYKLTEQSDDYDTFCRKKALFIKFIFDAYRLDDALAGSAMLKYIIDHGNLSAAYLKPLSRKIYPQVARSFACSLKQVNRAINYALRKSKYEGSTLDFLLFVANALERMARQAYSLEELATIRSEELAKVMEIA